MFSRHITRNFDANKTNRIRYDDDDFRCEIFRFDKTYEMQYTPNNANVTVKNGNMEYFNGFNVYRSKDDKDLIIEVEYDAKETSNNYRIELLFANTHRKTKKSKIQSSLQADAKIYIDGKQVKNSMRFIGTDVNFSRNYQYCRLDQGKRTIKYALSSNTIFVGLVIKKYDIWEARRHNTRNDQLTMVRASVEHTDEFSINTMSAEFMYYHKLDELLEPTNPNANRSGLVFDYRDEINLYVKNTLGVEQQVFGGYISTVEVNDDLTIVTMECADRLIDFDRRYCFSEINMKGFEKNKDDDYTARADYLKQYNNYSDCLKFLMNNNEIYCNTNVKIGTPLIKRNNRKLVNYKKGSYDKLTKSNMHYWANKGSITVRNGANTLKPQYCVIYDSDKAHKTVELNKYPSLYFHYGLGEHKWDEEVVDTTTVTVESNPTKAQKKWIDRVNTITTGNSEASIKAVWRKVASFHQDKRSDFFQSADKTWNTKNGNCCCKTECMLNLLNALGVNDLKYVHMKKGSNGHVFARVNGYYVDPSSSQESRGWKNHITYPKGAKIIKVTNYPTKPF